MNMAYNTNTFFALFLPFAMLIYQVTKKKYRWVALLLSSIVFFMLISNMLIGFAFLTTLFTYAGALFIEDTLTAKKLKKSAENIDESSTSKTQDLKKRLTKEEKQLRKRIAKRYMILAIVLVVSILVVLKYSNFFIMIVNNVFALTRTKNEISYLKLFVPIGISFYTMQAIGYLVDVYFGRIEAEKNFFKLFLFMIFFPTLMEGPICRWTDLNNQLFEGKSINSDSFINGFIRIVWGLFKRMVISDRLNAAIIFFYKPSASYTGLMIFICMLVTTIQLYMEFSGTIDIVIGTARIFNIKLPENFKQPFLAKSAAEFWRRWHISLGTWFKNYIFYPVSTSSLMKKWNKYGRKHCGKYLTNVVISAIALFPVWMLNGLWHGPQTTYIMYGVYYFVILLLEVAIEPVGTMFWNRIGFDENGKLVSGFKMVRTWMIILIGEMLFRANSLKAFGIMMKNMFTAPYDGDFFSGKIFEIGLDAADYIVAIIGIIIVFAVELKMEKNPEYLENIPKLSTPKRWAIYYALILAIVIFGAYGAGYQPADLIYAGF
ncbi:MBOAT family O-acyltransferase [Butyrivibrio sp. NC3005]|uniref:MBOAT family O-acyltransferase n=1 Tax=Butyrivibrio sp. NC3005 TaxID=1280685 RepID=UPI000411D817|nr:MBOAT family O-acyltransferase [Butyrivibrio sp. NC3005]